MRLAHKFAAGDRVSVMADRTNMNARAGIYTIVRTMPVTGQVCQYRVKNALDSHERVLDEAQLTQV
jgi:hypothetical protein